MDAALSLPVLVALIAVALAFDLLNGLHDAANSIATVVSTKVLTPRLAVAWASFWNLVGALSGTAVAATIAKGLVDPNAVNIERAAFAVLGKICTAITDAGNAVAANGINVQLDFTDAPGAGSRVITGVEMLRSVPYVPNGSAQ